MAQDTMIIGATAENGTRRIAAKIGTRLTSFPSAPFRTGLRRIVQQTFDRGAALAGREDTIEANRDVLNQRIEQGRYNGQLTRRWIFDSNDGTPGNDSASACACAASFAGAWSTSLMQRSTCLWDRQAF